MKRFGYRKDFSKVAVEKALFELEIFYDKWMRLKDSNHNEDVGLGLFFKTYGIISHDRKCLYLN